MGTNAIINNNNVTNVQMAWSNYQLYREQRLKSGRRGCKSFTSYCKSFPDAINEKINRNLIKITKIDPRKIDEYKKKIRDNEGINKYDPEIIEKVFNKDTVVRSINTDVSLPQEAFGDFLLDTEETIDKIKLFSRKNFMITNNRHFLQTYNKRGTTNTIFVLDAMKDKNKSSYLYLINSKFKFRVSLLEKYNFYIPLNVYLFLDIQFESIGHQKTRINILNYTTAAPARDAKQQVPLLDASQAVNYLLKTSYLDDQIKSVFCAGFEAVHKIDNAE